MQFLFIGGPENGQWHDIPEYVDVWRFAERPVLTFPSKDDCKACKSSFKTFLYKRRKRFSKNREYHDVMVYDGT